jgi:hypothetical protein
VAGIAGLVGSYTFGPSTETIVIKQEQRPPELPTKNLDDDLVFIGFKSSSRGVVNKNKTMCFINPWRLKVSTEDVELIIDTDIQFIDAEFVNLMNAIKKFTKNTAGGEERLYSLFKNLARSCTPNQRQQYANLPRENLNFLSNAIFPLRKDPDPELPIIDIDDLIFVGYRTSRGLINKNKTLCVVNPFRLKNSYGEVELLINTDQQFIDLEFNKLIYTIKKFSRGSSNGEDRLFSLFKDLAKTCTIKQQQLIL